MAMTRKQRTQLSAFIRQKRATRRRSQRDTSVEVDSAPVGFWFTPQRHGLTPAQCRVANQVLRRRQQERPIRGMSKQARFRMSLRIAGILSAVKGGRVGNSHFGYQLHGHRGGKAMRDHALLHLRAIAPLGARAAQAAREGRQVLKAWAQRQRHPQRHEDWPQHVGTGPRQESMPKDFMAW
jgi:hypothetical protein